MAVAGGDACLAGLLLLRDGQLTVLPPSVLETPQEAAAAAEAEAEVEAEAEAEAKGEGGAAGEGRCEAWSRYAVHFPLPMSVHADGGDTGTAAVAEAGGGGCVVAHGVRVLVARGATLVQRPLLSSGEAEVRAYAPQAAIACIPG